MEELESLPRAILFYSSVLFAITAIVGLMASIKCGSYGSLKKWFSFVSPAYFLFFGVIFFMGAILLSINRFSVSFGVVMMLIFWIIMLATSIKAFKESKDKSRHGEFKHFLQKKYLLDLALCLIVFIHNFTVYSKTY